MKFSIHPILLIIVIILINSCSTSKKLQPSVSNKDTVLVNTPPIQSNDTLKAIYNLLQEIRNKKIEFTTFSGKAKVQFEDKNGRQPDANAIIRMEKDSKIWMSISSTFLNIEVVRMLITPDSLVLINKLEKSVEIHPFKFIQDVVQLPITFSMLQDIIIGNPVFVGDSVLSTIITENNILIETGDRFIKNTLTISSANNFLTNSKINNLLNGMTRTANLEYSDYSALNQQWFATYRAVKVENPSKIDLRMLFKEFEFNNELSYPFSIPGNYKTK